MSSPSILIVDDDPFQLGLYRVVLRGLPCTVSAVESGAEALEVLQSKTPAVVILDLAMPGLSGLEVLRLIRADDRLNKVKIVVATAVPNLLDKQHATLTDMVLVKPVTLKDLKHVINEMIGG
jgi:CheY-like chemotaxis protein